MRWWEGADWTDLYRAPPSPSELEILARHGGPKSGASAQAGVAKKVRAAAETHAVVAAEPRGLTRRDAEELLAEVRHVARSEVDRAADVITQRARAATREIEPLISQYTNKLMRWGRIAAAVAFTLLVAWIVFQAIVQQSFLDWIGDRIDSLSD